MAITKKLIHFNQFSNFNMQKLSANRENTAYTIGVSGAVTTGEPYILFHSIVFIKDVLKIWTHGLLYDCGAVDLSDYLTAEEIAEVYATIEALNGKQDTISDLEAIRSGASKGATALQSFTETDPVFSASAAAGIKSSDITNWNNKTSNTGTITGIKMNGTSKGTSGVVDLGTIITEHQDISGKLDATVAASTYATKTEVNGKQDKILKFVNVSASNWVADTTYADYPYRCDAVCSGVTSSMYPQVIYGLEQAVSGEYAPVCESRTNAVRVWSSKNTSIVIPTILITT